MASKTNIAVMALGHIGVNVDVTDIDAEESAEGDAILAYWDMALLMLLEDKKPNWAENYVNLSLVATNPNDLWTYSFRYPADCAVALSIVDNAAENVTDRGEIPMRMGSDSTGRLIYTDNGPTSVLHYIRTQDDSEGWRMEDMPGTWAIAMSYLLASLGAGSLAKSPGLSNQMLQKYELMATRAQMSSSNEEGHGSLPMSAAARARS